MEMSVPLVELPALDRAMLLLLLSFLKSTHILISPYFFLTGTTGDDHGE